MTRPRNPEVRTVIVECFTAKLPEVLKALKDGHVTLTREPFQITRQTHMFEVLVDDQTMQWIAKIPGVCGVVRHPPVASC